MGSYISTAMEQAAYRAWAAGHVIPDRQSRRCGLSHLRGQRRAVTGDPASTLIDAARRRATLLNGWAHPERYAPLALPESLPAGVPPVVDFYLELLDQHIRRQP